MAKAASGLSGRRDGSPSPSEILNCGDSSAVLRMPRKIQRVGDGLKRGLAIALISIMAPQACLAQAVSIHKAAMQKHALKKTDARRTIGILSEIGGTFARAENRNHGLWQSISERAY
jgi:hypothetical protein